jgi:hypothetical protein
LEVVAAAADIMEMKVQILLEEVLVEEMEFKQPMGLMEQEVVAVEEFQEMAEEVVTVQL